jgi:hypothetical protein
MSFHINSAFLTKVFQKDPLLLELEAILELLKPHVLRHIPFDVVCCPFLIYQFFFTLSDFFFTLANSFKLGVA